MCRSNDSLPLWSACRHGAAAPLHFIPAAPLTSLSGFMEAERLEFGDTADCYVHWLK